MTASRVGQGCNIAPNTVALPYNSPYADVLIVPPGTPPGNAYNYYSFMLNTTMSFQVRAITNIVIVIIIINIIVL